MRQGLMRRRRGVGVPAAFGGEEGVVSEKSAALIMSPSYPRKIYGCQLVRLRPAFSFTASIQAVIPIERIQRFTPRDEHGPANFQERNPAIMDPVVDRTNAY